jgi:hypothetical protein
MPATIKMSLSNGNPTSAQIAAFRGYSNMSPVPVTKSTQVTANGPLNAGMIHRIHTTKPGCGSCGRK